MKKANTHVEERHNQNEPNHGFRQAGPQLHFTQPPPQQPTYYPSNNNNNLPDCRYTIVELGPSKDVDSANGGTDFDCEPAEEAEGIICGSEVSVISNYSLLCLYTNSFQSNRAIKRIAIHQGIDRTPRALRSIPPSSKLFITKNKNCWGTIAVFTPPQSQ
jgi:hypothetical protein